MKNFTKFEDFYNDLCASVETEVDVYVFGYTIDNVSDYQKEEQEDGTVFYYVDNIIDFEMLQSMIEFKFDDDGNLAVSFDHYIEDDFRVKRLFIFRTVN